MPLPQTSGDGAAHCVLELRGEAGSVEIARHVVSVLCRVWSLDDETVEDARLAVSELVTAAIVSGSDRVTVSCTRSEEGEVDLEVSLIEPSGLVDGPVDRGDVVEALFAGSALTDGSFRVAIGR